MPFKNKTVLITGTSTGFGKLSAITLAKAGHTVIAAMRGTTGKNAAVAQELAALPNIHVVEMDITSDTSVQNAIQQTLAQHGKIDVLVNNAAVTGYGVLEAYSLNQVREMLDVNLFSVLRTYQAVLPSMREKKNGLHQCYQRRQWFYHAFYDPLLYFKIWFGNNYRRYTGRAESIWY